MWSDVGDETTKVMLLRTSVELSMGRRAAVLRRANGPVCRTLFNRTRGKFKVSAFDERGDSSCLSDNQIDTINKVLEHYASHDAQWLSQLTHLEAPYKEARKGIPAGVGSERIISKASMAMYYGGI